MVAKSVRNSGRERIEVKDLRNFVVVAEEENFSRAAMRLGIQQSPLSRSIQRLEVEMDTVLFDRTGKRTSLTPSGVALLRHASQLLDGVAQLYDGTFLDHTSRRVRIGASFTANGKLLISLLQRGAANGNLVIDLQPLVQGCASEFKDFDVIVSPEAVPHAGITDVPLWRENLYVLLATGHPLAKHQTVSFDELAVEGTIFCPSDLEFHATGVSRETSRKLSFLPYLDNRLIEAHFAFGRGCLVLPASLLQPIDASIAIAKPIGGDGSSFLVSARYVESGATERLASFVYSLSNLVGREDTNRAGTTPVRSAAAS